MSDEIAVEDLAETLPIRGVALGADRGVALGDVGVGCTGAGEGARGSGPSSPAAITPVTKAIARAQ
jgi:hypothetical protein